MAAEPSFGQLKSTKETVTAPPPETPFRMVILGDFSGRGSRGEVGSAEDIVARKTYKIGRDNFDDILKKVGVKISVPGPDGDGPCDIDFAALDDFHPDAIVPKVSQFSDLDEDDQSKLLAVILHDAGFQAVESAWRGLWWLLARVKEIRQIQGVLVDISQAELIADLNAVKDLKQTGLYQLLVEKPAAKIEGQPWSLLVGLYHFEASADHGNVLGRMAKIAREAASPFLASIDYHVSAKDWEMPEDAKTVWDALRKLPEAPMLGLAMPRFLLRLPYGSNTASIDPFPFEEYTGPKGPDTYLWGNPALLCANLLAQAFAKDGWARKAGTVLDLAEMVMHVYTDEDDDKVTRLAEVALARKEGEKIAPMGFMNFICSKNRDIMQLIRFQSVGLAADGKTPVDLLGQWGQKGAIKLPPSSSKMPVGVSVVADVGKAPPAAKAAPQPEPAAAEAEPEPAAAEPEAAEAPAAPVAAEEAMDPELAALMAQLEGGDAAEPKKEEKPAEEEMDPELAALMKQLEGGDAAPAEKKEDKPAEEEMDPELAALMKQLEGGDAAPAEKKEDKPAEEEMDPELAALMKQLEGN